MLPTLGKPRILSSMMGGMGASPLAPHATAAAPAPPAATATLGAMPASATQAQNGNPIAPPLYSGRGSGAAGIRKRLLQMNYQNAQQANGPLWDSINELIGQANTDRFSPEGRAQFLAPRMEAYNQQERMVQGRALADQSSRGIDDSSYGAAASGAISAGFGGARAGAINDLYQSEEQRQLQAQAMLRDVLNNLQGRSSNSASSISNDITNFRQQQQQLDQAGNFDLNGLLSSLGMVGGAYLGRPKK